MSEPDNASMPGVLIGIDIGGTFTDFVVWHETQGTLRTFKVLSTPAEPAKAVLHGLASISEQGPRVIVHGSTVATNALLERKGARTAFVTTRGFRDLLIIGRQARRRLYDLFCQPSPPLISEECSLEITERMDPEGEVLQSIQQEEFPDILDILKRNHVESVAVSLLFSFVNPQHETWLAQELRKQGWFVTASHEVVPEFREFERSSTTVVNAYVSPILNRYLGALVDALAPATFHLLQSNGGRLEVAQARQQGVRSILSGPAGGVIGAWHLARLAGFDSVITFDMGGTSTDVSFLKGGISVTSESEIDGIPIRVPVIDIHTVGAGGGSLAAVSQGGILRVGPESAGADPGPVCYGRGGTIPTVTDANVWLGRLPEGGMFAERVSLDGHSAGQALAHLVRQLDWHPAGNLDAGRQLAKGMIDIVNIHMEQAIRVISVERGYDPRECVLVSFGGAGGLHACELARHIGIARVFIPKLASTLSALGMLIADVVLDYSRTVMCADNMSWASLDDLFTPLLTKAAEDIRHPRYGKGRISFIQELDMRYMGQSFELRVPFSPQFREHFDQKHQERFGFSDSAFPVEIVTVRVRAISQSDPPPIPTKPLVSSHSHRALLNYRDVVVEHDMRSIPFYDWSRLLPGDEIPGPAIILQPDTTIFLGDEDYATVDVYENLVVNINTF